MQLELAEYRLGSQFVNTDGFSDKSHRQQVLSAVCRQNLSKFIPGFFAKYANPLIIKVIFCRQPLYERVRSLPDRGNLICYRLFLQVPRQRILLVGASNRNEAVETIITALIYNQSSGVIPDSLSAELIV